MAEVLAIALLGAAWRRWYGLAPIIKAPWIRWSLRGLKVAVGFLLGVAVTIPLWAGMAWWQVAAAAGLLTLYWIPGHRLTEWSLPSWQERYAFVPGVFWWLANRLPNRIILKPVIDGNNAIAELASGAFWYGLWAWLVRM